MNSKVIEGHKSSSNFSVNLTLPLMDRPLILPSPNCVDLSLYLSKSSPSIALNVKLWTLVSCESLVKVYLVLQINC